MRRRDPHSILKSMKRNKEGFNLQTFCCKVAKSQVRLEESQQKGNKT